MLHTPVPNYSSASGPHIPHDYLKELADLLLAHPARIHGPGDRGGHFLEGRQGLPGRRCGPIRGRDFALDELLEVSLQGFTAETGLLAELLLRFWAQLNGDARHRTARLGPCF